jgi:16S rRNA (guanine527-N7)-methyltransferase
MQNGNDAQKLPQLPPDLANDFERFRAALLERADVLPIAPPVLESAIDRFREYGRLLYERAASLSLISKGDRPQIYTRHILDSLNPLAVFPEPPGSAWDIGSGGGLPGIPLAIVWPGTRVTLLDSRDRKAGFLEQAVRSLRLSNARVVCSRLEDLQPAAAAERGRVILVRALGGLAEILGRSARLAGEHASWVYFLGDRTADDVLDPEEQRLWGAEVASGTFGGRLLRGRFGGSLV